MHGKREELGALLAEVGQVRFVTAITKVVREHQDAFCPPISIIRTFVPAATDKKPFCGNCNNGWIVTPKGAVRCECRRTPFYDQWAADQWKPVASQK